MNIDPKNTTSHVYAQNVAKQNQTAAAKGSEQAAESKLATGADKLELGALDALRSQPEIRPEVVAKGKELLKDPNWPSQEMINDIAKLIVPFADEE